MQNSDQATNGSPDSNVPASVKKRLSGRKKQQILIGGVVILIAFLIIFWGWGGTENRTYVYVSQIVAEEDLIVANTSQYCNRNIEVLGIVSDWDGSSHIFKLVDRNNASQVITVNMTAVFPDGFSIGKSVVVKGILLNEVPIVIVANGVTVGCSSKY